MAQTGTNGHGLGARRIGPGSCVEPGPKGPDEPGPMAHVAALLSVLGENIVDNERSGINGITRAEPKDIKAFQMNSEKVDSWHGIIISPT